MADQIPDEAVYAAVKALPSDPDYINVESVRDALAAALPHLCLFPNRLYPSGEYHSACGECQRCDPDGLLARIVELEAERDEWRRSECHVKHCDEDATLGFVMNPGDGLRYEIMVCEAHFDEGGKDYRGKA